MRTALRWALLAVLTAGATAGLTLLTVPAAALFAALVVGTVLAVAGRAPAGLPRRAGLAAQGVLGVYTGTMVSPESLAALGPHWLIVSTVTVATLVLSVGMGALLGCYRGITPLTGALAMVAGGASGLVAIARELDGDDRVVAVVQYLRVGLVTSTMPLVVYLAFTPDPASAAPIDVENPSLPWYSNLALLAAVTLAGILVGRVTRLPGGGLLGPLALTVGLELSGTAHGLAVPDLVVQLGYALIGWQAGLAFTRAALRAVGRALPGAIGLIALLTVGTAGLGVLLAHVTGKTALEGYLATSPGGVYAVLLAAVETGCDVTFIVAAQVLRILVMLFGAPLLARGFVAAERRRQSRAITAPSRAPIAVAD